MRGISSFTRVLAAGVLIIAGFAKLSAIASTGGDVTTWLTTSQGLAEIYFGVWIASGYFPKESRMWTLAVFAAFFAFNVYQITQGYTSCGCFGAIRFPPLFSAGINFLIFGLTLFATAGENHRPSLNPILSGILITATIIGISLAAGFPRGGKVLVSPLAIELEYDFVNGMEYRIPLVVQNMSSAPVRISGWRTNHFYADIPSFQRMDLAPRDSGKFTLVITMPKVEPFERKELIDGLSGFGSREAAEAWEKKRTLSFYDQYGDDIVAVLIRERIPRAIISSYLKE